MSVLEFTVTERLGVLLADDILTMLEVVNSSFEYVPGVVESGRRRLGDTGLQPALWQAEGG
jgi:hypothetical protein